MAVVTRAKEISDMIDLLPESEQTLAYEFIKRMVIAWDSDFTKLTPVELARLEEAEQNFINGETVSHNDIDWD